jgi:hypothetical protein
VLPRLCRRWLGRVLHDNITWLERDFGPVIEFEACAHAVLNRTHVPRKKRYDQRNAPRSAEPRSGLNSPDGAGKEPENPP